MAPETTPRAARLALIQLHVCVLLWGFTAVLGKMIAIAALNLVLWRVILAGFALLLFLRWQARSWRLTALDRLQVSVPSADWRAMWLASALIAFHWVAFYASVKASNASIGVLCMCCSPIFSALFAPLFGAKFSWRDLLMALGVVPGMLLVVGGVDSRFYLGIALGIFAAMLVAGFGFINKKLVQRYEVTSLCMLQMFFAALALAPLVIWQGWQLPNSKDFSLLVVFALLCTAVPFVMAAAALRHLSVFSSQFAINLEPVYGIVFAALLLGESGQLSMQFYAGATVIVAAVALQSWLQQKDKKV